MKSFLYSILILIFLATGLYFVAYKNDPLELSTPNTSNYDEYINYKSSEYGPEFTYPKSWGAVLIKPGNKVCPEEDTYRSADTLNLFDWEFAFPEKKLADSESFIRTGVRLYELDPKNLNDCGGEFLYKISTNEINPETISSVKLTKTTTRSGITGIYNEKASRLNTESRQQYTFFIRDGSTIYIIQPYASFIPVFDSKELTELEDKFNGNMGEYISNGETAGYIRTHFTELKKLAGSLDFSGEMQ